MLRTASLLRFLWRSAGAPTVLGLRPRLGTLPAFPSPSAGAAAASFTSPCSSLHTSSRVALQASRANTAAAAAAAAAGAAEPAGGSSPSSSGSSSSVGYSPLQRCLLSRGVVGEAGVGYWGGPAYSGLSESWVQASLEPKLVALEREGLGSEQVARLLRQHLPIPCDLQPFLQNLEDLRALLAPIGLERLAASDAWVPGMTAPGLLAARSPACLAKYLSRPAGSLPANAGWLEGQLGIGRGQLADMVFRRPCVLTVAIGPELLEVLQELDALAGVPGWGRRLLDSDPLVLTYALPTVRGNLAALRGAGYTAAEICGALEQQGNLLVLELGSSAHRQLFAFIREESGWALADFLREPKYLAVEARRPAARLAFLRSQGLPVPPGPTRMVLSTDAAFCKAVSGDLGRELTPAAWAAWAAQWAETPAGRRWAAEE